jgi:ankyrin repeat protein
MLLVASLIFTNQESITPLHCAIVRGHMNVVHLLLGGRGAGFEAAVTAIAVLYN